MSLADAIEIAARTFAAVAVTAACVELLRQWWTGALAGEERDAAAMGAEAESRSLLGRALTEDEVAAFEAAWREQWHGERAAQRGEPA